MKRTRTITTKSLLALPALTCLALLVGLARAEAGSIAYTYDDAGRLTQISGVVGERTYQLDAAGNRTTLNAQVLAILGISLPRSVMLSADAGASNADRNSARPPLLQAQNAPILDVLHVQYTRP
ncbi:RHS repeat domain-containing protein [Polycyclovorans algicola]|uniref:RHS repeat domain-containing protein n=1 Tax=Polycyclovorans algicola TaxID=616992 RepID=UPI0012681AD1|nr:RHS repeat domain-containing protein [Polycyclovorans algicola]